MTKTWPYCNFHTFTDIIKERGAMTKDASQTGNHEQGKVSPLRPFSNGSLLLDRTVYFTRDIPGRGGCTIWGGNTWSRNRNKLKWLSGMRYDGLRNVVSESGWMKSSQCGAMSRSFYGPATWLYCKDPVCLFGLTLLRSCDQFSTKGRWKRYERNSLQSNVMRNDQSLSFLKQCIHPKSTTIT